MLMSKADKVCVCGSENVVVGRKQEGSGVKLQYLCKACNAEWSGWE